MRASDGVDGVGGDLGDDVGVGEIDEGRQRARGETLSRRREGVGA